MHLVQKNAVIVAHNFNVLVFTEGWLLRQGIVAEGAIQQGALFTPAIVQFATPDYQALVTPEQLQIVPLGEESSEARSVQAIGGKIVGTIPHTPFAAVGINFIWASEPVSEMNVLSRQFFLNPSCPLVEHFGDASAFFGGYFSKEFHGFRLRLTVLPSFDAEKHAYFHLAFNYHTELTQADASTRIVQLLGHWEDAKMYSQNVAQLLEGAL